MANQYHYEQPAYHAYGHSQPQSAPHPESDSYYNPHGQQPADLYNDGPQRLSPFDNRFEVDPYAPDPYGYGHDGDLGVNHPPRTDYSDQTTGSHTNSDPFGEQNAVPLQTMPPTDHGAHAESKKPSKGHKSRRKKPKQQIKKKWYHTTWVVWILTAIQVIVFLVELIKNGMLTGTPIAIKPQFNPTLGPSPYLLINMGARYVPCMKNVDRIQNSPLPIMFPCPNTTTNDSPCSLSDLCGLSGVPNPVPGGSIDDRPAPNQWYRFVIPIFLHAGIIHIAFNLYLQVTLGREIETKIGPLRFLAVYLASGIFGFVFGGNFSGPGIPSMGASGSLFGIIAISLLDLLYHWSEVRQPVRELCFIIVGIVFSLVLGLLPGIDNFSHIGGFLIGLGMGLCILHTPEKLRKRIGADAPPYQTVASSGGSFGAGAQNLINIAKNPVGFFKGRGPGWWVWWLVRAGALIAVLISFILLLRNFYVDQNECTWCKYLSCIPVKNWCDIGNLEIKAQ